MNKASTAVILARVSTKEQEQGYSIDAQKQRLEEYCLHKDLDVIQIFEITESSNITNRKKFMNMISFVKKQKGVIAIVVDKVDRLQRSFNEYPILDELIKKTKSSYIFALKTITCMQSPMRTTS